uniref:Uncharacterized protein n=1 Tax=Physcomitrium patens TaxID=3218 RepID=A0A2K1IRG5_PHYPA|nr:hypothetical protein PHYPA_025990 [Physcomitrium patens]
MMYFFSTTNIVPKTNYMRLQLSIILVNNKIFINYDKTCRFGRNEYRHNKYFRLGSYGC